MARGPVHFVTAALPEVSMCGCRARGALVILVREVLSPSLRAHIGTFGSAAVTKSKAPRAILALIRLRVALFRPRVKGRK